MNPLSPARLPIYLTCLLAAWPAAAAEKTVRVGDIPGPQAVGPSAAGPSQEIPSLPPSPVSDGEVGIEAAANAAYLLTVGDAKRAPAAGSPAAMAPAGAAAGPAAAASAAAREAGGAEARGEAAQGSESGEASRAAGDRLFDKSVAGAAAQAPGDSGQATAAQPRRVSLLGRLLPWTSRQPAGPSPKTLLRDAALGQDKNAVVQGVAALFDLVIRQDASSYHAYKPDGRGVPVFGSGDYYPDHAAYLVSPAAIELTDRALSGAASPKALGWAAPMFEALAKYADAAPGRRAEMLARLAALRSRPRVQVDGRSFVAVGALDYGKELPVRLAQDSDWAAAPPVRANGLTGQEVLDLKVAKGRDGGYPAQFGDILSAPIRYTGNGTTGYARGLPVVEGSDVFLVAGGRAIRGVYNGFWNPGSTRGLPLAERLRHSRSLKGVARLHFVEVEGADGHRVILAADGRDESLRIFSTARSRD